jgi:hypothetical protein
MLSWAALITTQFLLLVHLAIYLFSHAYIVIFFSVNETPPARCDFLLAQVIPKFGAKKPPEW